MARRARGLWPPWATCFDEPRIEGVGSCGNSKCLWTGSKAQAWRAMIASQRGSGSGQSQMLQTKPFLSSERKCPPSCCLLKSEWQRLGGKPPQGWWKVAMQRALWGSRFSFLAPGFFSCAIVTAPFHRLPGWAEGSSAPLLLATSPPQQLPYPCHVASSLRGSLWTLLGGRQKTQPWGPPQLIVDAASTIWRVLLGVPAAREGSLLGVQEHLLEPAWGQGKLPSARGLREHDVPAENGAGLGERALFFPLGQLAAPGIPGISHPTLRGRSKDARFQPYR